MSLDTQIMNELLTVLQQETAVYDDILGISKNKTNIIVEGKVTELENIVKLEQSLVIQLGRFEAAREKLVGNLSAQMNMNARDITITKLIKQVKDMRLADKLKECQKKMNGIISELRSSNELNSKLIKNSLDFINFSVNLLSGMDAGNNTYGSSGQSSDLQKRNFFDIKL